MSTISVITSYVIKVVLLPVMVTVLGILSVNTAVFRTVLHAGNYHKTVVTTNTCAANPSSLKNSCTTTAGPGHSVCISQNTATTPVESGSAEKSVLENIESAAKYWPQQVDSFIKLENSSPLTQMRIDRYYWMHYLAEIDPVAE
ncbi:MAG: hypothetical protein NTU44_06135 [Bacteroidetes bacterium]|nr:hypothetical protein [Bacteroidota bacterium]